MFDLSAAFLTRWDSKIRGREEFDAKAILDSFLSSMRLTTSLASAIYSCGKWTVELDPDRSNRVRIEITDAVAYSEGMRYAIEGFFNECTRAVRSDTSALYVSERVAPHHIRLWQSADLVEFYRMLGT